jgi:hypothetical protein
LDLKVRKIDYGENYIMMNFTTCILHPNIVRVIKLRRMRRLEHVTRIWLRGRREGKRPLGRPRSRWEDNIKLDLREMGIDGANWIRVGQDRVRWQTFVSTVMNIRVP